MENAVYQKSNVYECKIVQFSDLQTTSTSTTKKRDRIPGSGATIGGANAIQDMDMIRDILDYFFNHKNQKNYKSFGIRNCALLTFGFNTNLRGGDVLSLKLRDIIDPDTGKILDYYITKEKKTGKPKKVILNSSIKKSLTIYLETERPNYLDNLEEPVFCSRQKNSSKIKESGIAKPITIQRYNQLLKEVKEKLQLNVGKLSTHSCRKSWARNIYNSYSDDKKQHALTLISYALNHSNIETTMIYLDINDDELTELSKNYSVGRSEK